MSVPLLIAAALTILVALAHSYLGERYILIRLFRRSDLPTLFGDAEFTKRTLRLAWHITTVLAFGFAGLLVALASPTGITGRATAFIIALACMLSGLVALVVSRGKHLSWIAFLAIAALTWFGYR